MCTGAVYIAAITRFSVRGTYYVKGTQVPFQTLLFGKSLGFRVLRISFYTIATICALSRNDDESYGTRVCLSVDSMQPHEFSRILNQIAHARVLRTSTNLIYTLAMHANSPQPPNLSTTPPRVRFQASRIPQPLPRRERFGKP